MGWGVEQVQHPAPGPRPVTGPRVQARQRGRQLPGVKGIGCGVEQIQHPGPCPCQVTVLRVQPYQRL
jgi:hypothetical protein